MTRLRSQAKINPLPERFGAPRIPWLFSFVRRRLRRGPSQCWRRAMDGNIFNSRGEHVGVVLGPSILDLRGRRIYDLKGIKVYKLSGELVGHLPADARNSERRLDKSTDKLFR
jgi:hypothetical protein